MIASVAILFYLLRMLSVMRRKGARATARQICGGEEG